MYLRPYIGAVYNSTYNCKSGAHFLYHLGRVGEAATTVSRFLRCRSKSSKWRGALAQRILGRNKDTTWHILGDRLIPLAPLSLVGFYMPTIQSLTFSPGDLRVAMKKMMGFSKTYPPEVSGVLFRWEEGENPSYTGLRSWSFRSNAKLQT